MVHSLTWTQGHKRVDKGGKYQSRWLVIFFSATWGAALKSESRLNRRQEYSREETNPAPTSQIKKQKRTNYILVFLDVTNGRFYSYHRPIKKLSGPHDNHCPTDVGNLPTSFIAQWGRYWRSIAIPRTRHYSKLFPWTSQRQKHGKKNEVQILHLDSSSKAGVMEGALPNVFLSKVYKHNICITKKVLYIFIHAY